jgi:hypothetical protein
MALNCMNNMHTGVDMVPRQRRVEPSVRERAAVDAAPATATLPPVPLVAEVLHHVPLAHVHLSDARARTHTHVFSA